MYGRKDVVTYVNSWYTTALVKYSFPRLVNLMVCVCACGRWVTLILIAPTLTKECHSHKEGHPCAQLRVTVHPPEDKL